MKRVQKIRAILALGLACALVVINFRAALREIETARAIPPTDGPFFFEWEARFDPIKEDIPFSQGLIGYASDWDLSGAQYSPADAGAEHILTQYSLAPIVVARDDGREWIIANLSAGDFETWLAAQEGEFRVTRYRKNLYLVQRIQ
jgi:hypothetical protein